MSREAADAAIERALEMLSEHFDAVQILGSFYIPRGENDPDAGGTRHCYRGRGNWHTRTGMAQHFLTVDHTDEQARALASVIHPPDSD